VLVGWGEMFFDEIPKRLISRVLSHWSCESVITGFYFLANVNYVVVRPSVCRLSVTFVLLRRLKFSAMFLCHLVRWPSLTFR